MTFDVVICNVQYSIFVSIWYVMFQYDIWCFIIVQEFFLNGLLSYQCSQYITDCEIFLQMFMLYDLACDDFLLKFQEVLGDMNTVRKWAIKNFQNLVRLIRSRKICGRDQIFYQTVIMARVWKQPLPPSGDPCVRKFKNIPTSLRGVEITEIYVYNLPLLMSSGWWDVDFGRCRMSNSHCSVLIFLIFYTWSCNYPCKFSMLLNHCEGS